MAKKMYDIKPPKVARAVENAIKEMDATSARKKRAARQIQSHKKERALPWLWPVAGGVVVVLMFLAYGYVKLPKAEITLWPKMESLSASSKMNVVKSATAVDVAKKIIPAEYLEEMQEATQEFPASGSASNEGRATGTIKVYNKVSPSAPLALKTGTHFLSDSGKYFVTLDKIVIPAMKGKTPGSISVTVQAEESGADYNIGASKFSVPKLSGTVYYYGIYGESTTAMAGGYTGKVKKVTNADIASAKDTLTKKALEEAEASLRAKISSDKGVLDGAITREVVSATANAKAGAVVENFQETVRVKVSILVFKKADLETLVKNDITSQLTDKKQYLEKSLDIQYSIDSVDIQSGVETLNIKATVATYGRIDTLNLVDVVSQKTSGQIQQAISETYGDAVAKTEVNFWPFWVTSSPGNKNRITINLNFE